MSEEAIEIVRGSGNVFRDLDLDNPELRQLKALLAAEIIKTLDGHKLTVRDAAVQTGIAAADFSRIRGVKLDRFTVDRLMTILSRLGQEVKVRLSIRPRSENSPQPAAA
jgi:predicted XRE-type DNA-binding protein